MSELSLREELASRVAKALELIPEYDRIGIYAISFFVYDDEDDPRRPSVTIGYYTIDQLERSLPEASSELEAKWNFAFWIQNEIMEFGAGEDFFVDRWVKLTGLWFSDEEEEADYETCFEKGEEITKRWVRECCEVVKALHDSGVVARVFGKSLPVLVHELEYYDEIADQNEQSNPKGVCDEFIMWVHGQ